RGEAAGRTGCRSDVAEKLRDRRIERGELTVGGGKLQQVHLLHAGGRVVTEHAVGGVGRESDALQRRLARPALFFVVEEEERLVPDNWTTLRDPLLVVAQLRLRRLAGRRIGRQIAIVEPRVRVQRIVPQVFVGGAVPPVRPRFGDELDLDAALPRRVRGVAGGGHRPLFARVERRRQPRVIAVGSFQVVVLDTHAVERDVDRALRQAVDRRVARRARGVEAGQRRQRVERVAAGERQAGDLRRREVRRDR